jgi:hypothetical protein
VICTLQVYPEPVSIAAMYHMLLSLDFIAVEGPKILFRKLTAAEKVIIRIAENILKKAIFA